jgi:hypothetical protein
LRTGFHTLDRWLYNAGVAWSPPRDVDLVYGVDLDGFLWARARRLPFVVSLKGVIADELKNERGLTRARCCRYRPAGSAPMRGAPTS